MTFVKKAGMAASFLAVATLSAHFAWIDAPALKVGETAKVRIGNGHDIANSESAISLDGVKAWTVTPSGAKSDLKIAGDGKWVVANYSVKEAGAYRFYMIQDRGVLSQTPKGYKAGGRDVHPDAKKSMKIWRSAIAYASTANAKSAAAKPFGLDLELIAEPTADSVALTVYRSGKPFGGAAIAIGLPGKDDDEELGKADGNGKFTYKIPAGMKGPAVFIATATEPAHKGANYDTNNYAAAAYLNW